VSWELSGQIVGAPPAVANVAEAQLGASVGQSTTRENSITVTDATTDQEYVALRPGWIYCYYTEAKMSSTGPAQCKVPNYVEVELAATSGGAIAICGPAIGDSVQCQGDPCKGEGSLPDASGANAGKPMSSSAPLVFLSSH
jgi:hypothetical protein